MTDCPACGTECQTQQLDERTHYQYCPACQAPREDTMPEALGKLLVLLGMPLAYVLARVLLAAAWVRDKLR